MAELKVETRKLTWVRSYVFLDEGSRHFPDIPFSLPLDLFYAEIIWWGFVLFRFLIQSVPPALLASQLFLESYP